MRLTTMRLMGVWTALGLTAVLLAAQTPTGSPPTVNQPAAQPGIAVPAGTGWQRVEAVFRTTMGAGTTNAVGGAARCPAGKKVVGGGYRLSGSGAGWHDVTIARQAANGPFALMGATGEDGWVVILDLLAGAQAVTPEITVAALCVSP